MMAFGMRMPALPVASTNSTPSAVVLAVSPPVTVYGNVYTVGGEAEFSTRVCLTPALLASSRRSAPGKIAGYVAWEPVTCAGTSAAPDRANDTVSAPSPTVIKLASAPDGAKET